MLSPKLTPEIRSFLETIAAQGGPPMEALPVSEARKLAHGLESLAGEAEPVARVENRRIPGRAGEIPVRVYAPAGDGPFPGVVYFHGGGWVVCDLDTHDNVCRSIANRAQAVVVSVDYRLAPEHRFPAALNDCLDATHWVADQAAALRIDPQKLVIAGDSAGGNMATVIAAKARKLQNPRLALQILVYPVINLSGSDTASHREFAEGHFLTRSLMEWFLEQYVPGEEDRKNPDASPAFISDLRGMPPALVITAECDPLRDEGEAYAQRLRDAGVPVTLTRYDGMIHPFLNFPVIAPGASRALAQIATAIGAIR